MWGTVECRGGSCDGRDTFSEGGVGEPIRGLRAPLKDLSGSLTFTREAQRHSRLPVTKSRFSLEVAYQLLYGLRQG